MLNTSANFVAVIVDLPFEVPIAEIPAPEAEDKAWALYFEPGDILICGMGYGRHPVSGGKAYTKEGISHVTLQIKYDES